MAPCWSYWCDDRFDWNTFRSTWRRSRTTRRSCRTTCADCRCGLSRFHFFYCPLSFSFFLKYFIIRDPPADDLRVLDNNKSNNDHKCWSPPFPLCPSRDCVDPFYLIPFRLQSGLTEVRTQVGGLMSRCADLAPCRELASQNPMRSLILDQTFVQVPILRPLKWYRSGFRRSITCSFHQSIAGGGGDVLLSRKVDSDWSDLFAIATRTFHLPSRVWTEIDPVIIDR